MKELFTLIFFLSPFLVMAQVPNNDRCIDAIEIEASNLNCDFYSFEEAGFDFMSPTCSDDSLKNVWFKFKARGTAIKIEAYLFDDQDVYIQLYSFAGEPCDSISALPILCDTNKLEHGNLLELDEEYYINISADNSNSTDMIMCLSNRLINIDPVNDDICYARSVPFDNSCHPGTLKNATYDFNNPTCHGSDERSVWYNGLMPGNSRTLEIIFTPLSLDTFDYKVGVYRLPENDCSRTPEYIGGICGKGNAIGKINGLEPGKRYYIMVSSADVDGHTFEICFRPIVSPAGCASNGFCEFAEDIPLAYDDPPSCVVGCNIGAPTGPIDDADICAEFINPTVFYKIHVDSFMDEVNINLTSDDFVMPQLAVYYGECEELNFVLCEYGENGLLEATFIPPVRDTNYYILVSDILENTGYFNLCIDAHNYDVECSFNNELEVIATSLGSPLEGPYKAGEELHFRYTIDEWVSTKCNWLQGVVPTFISGWDWDAIENNGEIKMKLKNPDAHRNGEWGWYGYGAVHYNFDNPFKRFDEGEMVGAGWFFLEDGVEELDSSRGDGLNCVDSLDLEWVIEFKMRIVPYPGCVEDTIYNALIEFVTFSDGEIGKNELQACKNDRSTIFSVPFTCCSGPELENVTDTICSGETIHFNLNIPDTITEYRWTVFAGDYVEGASGAVGNEIEQTLVNTSYETQIVDYTLYAQDTTDCFGPPATYRVVVLPRIDVDAGDDLVMVCRDHQVRLGGDPTAQGGIPPLRYLWNDPDLSGTNPIITATESQSIILEIRDDARCRALDTVRIEVTESPVAHIPPEIDLCRGDTMELDIALTGTPPYSFYINMDGERGNKITTSYDTISLTLVGDSSMVIQIDSLIDAVCETEVENIGMLLVRDTIVEEYTETICGDEVLFIGSKSFDETGVYEVLLPNASQYGCDSTVILDLTVNELIRLQDTIIRDYPEEEKVTIAVTVSGGVPPYRYAWSNGRKTHFISKVPYDDYELLVTDAENCQRVFTFEYSSPTAVNVAALPDYSLYPQPVSAGDEIKLSLSNLEVGTYTFELYSATGEKVSTDKFVHENKNPSFVKAMEKPGMFYWHIKSEIGIVLSGKCVVL